MKPILHLNLKTKWFDKILLGGKTEEYREINAIQRNAASKAWKEILKSKLMKIVYKYYKNSNTGMIIKKQSVEETRLTGIGPWYYNALGVMLDKDFSLLGFVEISKRKFLREAKKLKTNKSSHETSNDHTDKRKTARACRNARRRG